MKTTNSGEVILDGTDSERLSKLIDWAAQFVNSIDHITVQEAAQFVRDWKARTAVAPPAHGKCLLSGPFESDRNPNHQ
jgi:hypothetical protein